MEMKICCKCKNEKNLIFFGKLKNSPDGLRYDCKECRKEYNIKNKEIFEKQQLNSYGLKKYKHLYYRGTYELLFITEFEKLFDINDLENGFAIKYYNEGKPKIYFPDFIIKSRNKIIEIKSSWTYDNNGKNYLLKMINDNKWEAAEALPNYSFFPLKSKDEIKIFIKML